MVEPIKCEEYEDNGMRFPGHMINGLNNYINHGVIPGQFLQAVITNDLRRAVSYADNANLAVLPLYVRFLYNRCPLVSWGSLDLMNSWHLQGGLLGTIKV